MKHLAYILAALLWSLSAAGYGDFVNVEWETMERDSLLPYCSYQIPLPDDFKGFRYSVEIEFPELVPLTDEEKSVWNVEGNADIIGGWPCIDATVSSSRREGFLEYGFIPLLQSGGEYYRINSFRPVIERVPMAMKVSSPVVSSTACSVLAEGRWYKIRVKSSGVYNLSESLLAKMGFNDPAKVRLYGYGGALLPETGLEEMQDDLTEIPLFRDGDNLLFYAQGPISWHPDDEGQYVHTQNTYSTYGCYFVTASDEEPLLPDVMDTVTGDVRIVETTPGYALYEKDEYSWYHGGRRFYDSYDFASNASQTYSFSLEDMADDVVNMTLSFSASGTVSSTVEARVNGEAAGTLSMGPNGSSDAANLRTGEFFCKGIFKNGENSVQLYHRHQDGISGRLDYIRLNYTRQLVLRGSSLDFRTGMESGDCRFRIASSSDNVSVWHLSADGSISLLPSQTYDGYCLTSACGTDAGDEFVAVNLDGSFPQPELVGAIKNQNLHGMDPVEMVIIVPASGYLNAQAERLADAHRRIDGMSVAVVPADMIYNEFSSGTPDATAYRRFLKMLYDRSDELKYLLLFGGGRWDNRMITDASRGLSQDDFLLCYEADNSINSVKAYVAEDYFALLADGKGGSILTQKPDIGVGRFPVESVEEARIMVDKTISYMQGDYAGDWQNTVLVLGDDGDNNLHMTQAERLARMIAEERPAVDIGKIFWDAYPMESSASGNSYPKVREDLLKRLNDGALLVNYTGHGSATVLSHEMVLGIEDFASFNSPRLPFWVTASCDISPFDNSGDMIGKAALLNGNGGAIGMFTTTRTVYSDRNEEIVRLFDHYVLDPINRLGDAVRLTKVSLVTPESKTRDYSENKLNYVLLGDPALRLAVPQCKVVIDSVNTGREYDGRPIAEACGMIRVSGHIENAVGEPLGRYNGILSTRAYDSMRKITCRGNDGQSDTCFYYYDYNRLLFLGQDSVRSGRFEFEYPVPKDINYSNETGRLVFYAISDEGLASSGSFCDFLVGGTSEIASSDTLGPDIDICLNSTDFEYWGKVNTTPCLMVELSDSTGINFSGNGTGHDLLLIIDNDTRYSYVLNDCYSPVNGDFRHGRILFNIPELPDGRHTLLFRAWDILGNSSSVTLGFETVSGLEPEISSVSLTCNPVEGHTSFVISHDRPGSVRNIGIQIQDCAGRLLWNHTSTESGTSGMSVVDWNGCSDSGQRLQPGLYIYKVILTDTDGAVETLCDKVIVM